MSQGPETGQYGKGKPKAVSSADSLNMFLTKVGNAYQNDHHKRFSSLEEFVYDLYKTPDFIPNFKTSKEGYKSDLEEVQNHHKNAGGGLTVAGGFPALVSKEDKDKLTSKFRIVVRAHPDANFYGLFTFWSKQVLNHPNVRTAKVVGDPAGAASRADPIVIYLVEGGKAKARKDLAKVTQELIGNYLTGLEMAGKLRELVPGVPPMVQEVYPGIGWAEQPLKEVSEDRSFGEYRANAIASVLPEAGNNMIKLYSLIPEAFRKVQLNFDYPHLNLGDL